MSRAPHRRGRHRAALGLALLAGSCIASNVLDPEQRLAAAPAAPEFAPAGVIELAGLYGSTDLEGEAAAQLRKVYYVFLPGGRYTGAALVDDGGVLAFQTLSGTYAVTADGLVLDGAPAVPLLQSGELLRLVAPGGVLTLRREELR